MTLHCFAPRNAVELARVSPRKRGLAVACGFALLASTAAQAQEVVATAAADAQTLDKVVVTGIRHSIETSVETKVEATSIVEAVSAEDIGKLPDISIADSISRLPGIATQR